MEADAQKDCDMVVELKGEFQTSQMRGVTFGDFSSNNVTSGDMHPSSELNVTFGKISLSSEPNNNYVPPFPVSDTAQPPTTMASQSAQLAATLANQAIPTPGTTPASTPSKGAISKKTTVTTTSTTAAKTTPTKTRKKKTKTAPAQEQTVSISRKRLTEILKLPEQIKSLQLRVTNAERALKRKTSTSNSDDFAKKPKVGSKVLKMVAEL